MEKHICEYCGAEANYQLKNKKWCCQPFSQSCPVNREKRRQSVQNRWDKLKEKGYKTQYKSELGDDRKNLNKSNAYNEFTDEEILERQKQLKEHPELCFCKHCGQPANYVLKSGIYCCEPIVTKCPINKEKNSRGVKESYKNGKKNSENNLWNGSPDNLRILQEATDRRVQRQMKEAFIEHSKASNTAINNYLKKYLHWEHRCAKCGLAEWQGNEIPLELHHKNGDSSDNRLENLEYLCLNCHATTKTFRGKNINSGKLKITDDQLEEALRECNSVRRALIKVGLAPKGGNYARAYKLLGNIKDGRQEDVRS